MNSPADDSPEATPEALKGVGSGKFRSALVFLFVLGLVFLLLAPKLAGMLGPLLAFVLLGIGAPLLSRQSAVHGDSRVDEPGGCLVITTPRPSHLRMVALVLLAIMVFFSPGLLAAWSTGVDGEALDPVAGVLVAVVGPLTLLLLPILLLVLLFGDRNTVQRVVWAHPRLYRSLSMGPLEFFSQRVPRRDDRLPVLVPPLAAEMGELMQTNEKMKAARAALEQQGMSSEQIDQWAQQYARDAATYGQINSSTLYWTIVLPHRLDRSAGANRAARGLALELARFKDEAPARALLQKLLAAWAPLPKNLDRVIGQDGVLATGLSTLASWLLRAPLYAGLALCLLGAWLAAEAQLTLHGKLDLAPAGDRVAEARIERFEWLISPVRRPNEDFDDNAAHTIATVRLAADDGAAGGARVLDWPHYGRQRRGYVAGVGEVLDSAARSRLLPAQLNFAVPRSVLDIEVDEHGMLRLDRLNMDRARARSEAGAYHQLYFGVLLGLDTLDRMLPIYWMQPGVEDQLRVVYSADDPAGTPVRREIDVLASSADRGSLHGGFAVMAVLGLVVGLVLLGLLAALNGHWQLADLHKPFGMAALWVLLCSSALFWMPRFPAAAGWVGLHSPAVDSLRGALQAEHSGALAETPVYDDADLVRGRWEPGGSRHARWLAELDLLAPLARCADSFEAAVEQLHAELSARLQVLDWTQRRQFLARYRPDLLRDNGSSRMHDEAIAPAICRWLASGEPEVESLQRLRNTLSHVRCES